MFTVEQLADTLHVSPATIYRRIKIGTLDATKVDGRLVIGDTPKNHAAIMQEFEYARSHPTPAWVPKGIKGYAKWHQLLDEFTWLLKVCYSDPATIKRKVFRLDKLLHSYIQANNVTVSKIRSTFASHPASTMSLVLDDLKRGWYNELAFSFPTRPSTLRQSFTDLELNKPCSNVRLAFPSWRITTAYYTAYFYLRAVTLIKQSGFRLEQHGTTIECFKNGVVSPLSLTLWRFPFDIAYQPGSRTRVAGLLCDTIGHAAYAYSCHPRAPHRGPSEIYQQIAKVFRGRGRKGKKPSVYTLFDWPITLTSTTC